MHPFRFGVQFSKSTSGDTYRESVRKIEDLGYSTVFCPDHFDDQWAPTVALTVAAEATSTLRVAALVYDVDYRHPVTLAKEIATLDVVSNGRVEFGIGAGWMNDDYNHVFVESVRDASLPVMGIDLENTILIVDEAHNLPDRIRSGLERRITERVFQRALSDVEEYKESMQKREADLEMPESNQLREAKSLEKQIRALRDDSGLRKWFEEKKDENKETKGDDVRVVTQDFLDVVSMAIGGILEEDPEDDISRLRMMIARLLSVVIEEDEDSDEDEQNDCTRLAEILEICIR